VQITHTYANQHTQEFERYIASRLLAVVVVEQPAQQSSTDITQLKKLKFSNLEVN
jgi:hypothetical protein